MNNKKIGIITVHRNVNYGANLQAYASNKYLIDQGFNAKIIDYLPKELDKDNYLFSWLKLSFVNGKSKSLVHNIKLFIALTLSAPNKYKKLKAFYGFRNKHCALSKKYKHFNDIIKDSYTDVVLGSDQIWNPDITLGISPLYFGDILGVKNKVSYAPSIGKEKYEAQDEIKAASLIKNIDYLSVREEKSVKYIEEISGKKPLAVCDPVFLLKKETYEEIAKPIKCKEPYLLVYSVIKNPKMLEAAIEFANNKGLKLVEICQNKKYGFKHLQLTAASPEEFLGAIKNAEYVVTNSFHGTAFSIIFNKELYVFDNKARGSRITGLLNKAGLNNRIVEGQIKLQKNIDYNKVSENLKDYINTSKEFLLNALNSEKEKTVDNCVGCGACKAVCKKDAISLIKNKQGFIKSYIDKNKCIDCGLCKKVCPVINTPIKNGSLKVYSYKAKDSLRKNSTSGGAAAALSEEVINKGGSVFGASLNKDFSLSHIKIESKKDIKRIQGTKYIQSDMIGSFNEIKADLSTNKTVLFIGTPCQVAAVKNYVLVNKIDDKNLYLCDIICHGVPSNRAFNDFILWLKEKENFDKFYFRNKEISWRGDSCSIKSGDNLKRSKYISGFMNLYYSNLITNNACFNCKFTEPNRVSDITISDFWGIENANAKFEDNLGVSMVLLNTKKGEDLFSSLSGKKQETEISFAKQPNLKAPTKKPNGYEEFWQNYNIDNALKKYGAIKENFKTKIYNIIKGRR